MIDICFLSFATSPENLAKLVIDFSINPSNGPQRQVFERQISYSRPLTEGNLLWILREVLWAAALLAWQFSAMFFAACQHFLFAVHWCQDPFSWSTTVHKYKSNCLLSWKLVLQNVKKSLQIYLVFNDLSWGR
jgi:hypothetical protein